MQIVRPNYYVNKISNIVITRTGMYVEIEFYKNIKLFRVIPRVNYISVPHSLRLPVTLLYSLSQQCARKYPK